MAPHAAYRGYLISGRADFSRVADLVPAFGERVFDCFPHHG